MNNSKEYEGDLEDQSGVSSARIRVPKRKNRVNRKKLSKEHVPPFQSFHKCPLNEIRYIILKFQHHKKKIQKLRDQVR